MVGQQPLKLLMDVRAVHPVYAKVAQLEERSAEDGKIVGSIPTLGVIGEKDEHK